MNYASMTRNRVLSLALVSWLGIRPPLDAEAPDLQVFDLEPGWNAVFLEVEPVPDDSGSVFGDLPVASVWTWNFPSPVQQVPDVDERLWKKNGWSTYFPPARPESILNNLFSVRAHRAYLIKLEGEQGVRWSVPGRRSFRPLEWVPDSFNLAGFPVDSASPPTFGAYFAASPAHAGQAIYRLDPGGEWDVVDPGAAIRRGEAYWVYCAGASEYTAPFSVHVEQGGRLEYGRWLVEQTLSIVNRRGVEAALSVRLLGSEIPVPLSHWNLDPAGLKLGWAPLPETLPVSLGAREELNLRLGVRRAELEGPSGRSLLEIADGKGTQILLPVTVEARGAALTEGEDRGGGAATPGNRGLWVGNAVINAVANLPASGLKGQYFDNIDFTGLKLSRTDGSISFDWGDNPPDPSLTADGAFSVRWTGTVMAEHSETYTFIVASSGGVRLSVNGQLIVDSWLEHPPVELTGNIALTAGLKVPLQLEYLEKSGGAAVTLLWKSPSLQRSVVPSFALGGSPAVLGPTASEFPLRLMVHVNATGQARLLKEVIQMRRQTSNELVLLTDDSLIPNFNGVALRDGEPVGRRISTVGFDFPDPPPPGAKGTAALTGTFGSPNTLRGDIFLPPGHPTNPYRHKFHPDHNNLDEEYDQPIDEAFPIRRRIELQFTPQDPEGLNNPAWGDTEMGGLYRETISGIHRHDLSVSGRFRLKLVSDVPALNGQ